MTVKVIEGTGITACPAGFYALYEGAGYNEADPECRRVLIADEPVPDLRTYDFDATADSLVNLSPYTVELYEGAGRAGEHLTFGPTISPRDLGGFGAEAGRSWSHRASSTDAFKAELTRRQPGAHHQEQGSKQAAERNGEAPAKDGNETESGSA
ncbi:peptidase inhibitor family I36 protein [Streptomyces sp. NPDC048248]|uniref:peptidase inhibitor family I36 protein n=1 Tax=Streptomyces sp. NPDC048248 TaxID=3365523 RepID=UPI003718C9D7